MKQNLCETVRKVRIWRKEPINAESTKRSLSFLSVHSNRAQNKQFDTNYFLPMILLGGCRELQWNPDSHDCKLYEGRLKGMYLGKVPIDREGVPFSDVVTRLEELIGDKLPKELSQQVGGGLLGASNYETKFLGVPAPSNDPNYGGGSDQSRDGLNEPVNIETVIDSSSFQANRKTITVVGGLLVACFSVAFFLVGYILFNRRRSYRNKNNDDEDDDDEVGVEVVGNLDYEFDHGNSHDDDDYKDGYGNGRQEEHYDEPGEYPNLPLSNEAIQMDLGPAMREQMMGSPPRTTSHFFSPERGDTDYHDVDDSDRDSWAQPDGTIGSLELQLEPITAEV